MSCTESLQTDSSECNWEDFGEDIRDEYGEYREGEKDNTNMEEGEE